MKKKKMKELTESDIIKIEGFKLDRSSIIYDGVEYYSMDFMMERINVSYKTLQRYIKQKSEEFFKENPNWVWRGVLPHVIKLEKNYVSDALLIGTKHLKKVSIK